MMVDGELVWLIYSLVLNHIYSKAFKLWPFDVKTSQL